MKKALALLGCVLLSGTFLFGCSLTDMMGCGGTTVDPILSQKPWSSSTDYEYISYGVTRYQVKATADGSAYTYGDVEAKGAYSTTLVTIAGNIYNSPELETIKNRSEYFANNLADEDAKLLSAAPGAYSVLYTDYSLTYTDVNKAYAGKTDKMTSVVLFKTSSLLPAFSEKIAATETSDNSYTAIADYVGGKNMLTTGGKTTETNIKKDSDSFDNELLYYVIRSSSSLAAGSGTSVTTHNSVYTGLNDSESKRSIYFSTNSALAKVSGIDPDKDGFISKYFADGEVEYNAETKKTEDGQIEYYKGYALPSYYVNMQLSAQDRGAVRSLFYATSGFNYVGDTTSNVLLQTIDFETNTEGEPAYATVSLINDYKISKLM